LKSNGRFEGTELILYPVEWWAAGGRKREEGMGKIFREEGERESHNKQLHSILPC